MDYGHWSRSILAGLTDVSIRLIIEPRDQFTDPLHAPHCDTGTTAACSVRRGVPRVVVGMGGQGPVVGDPARGHLRTNPGSNSNSSSNPGSGL